ncbi:hypothetical protein TNCV_4788991 [Trichonephila clavipes]|nr:hypothetical protein TNCV_4788991 [Trichonephila clavipes]
MGRTILLERRQIESVGRRNSRTTFLRSDWPRPFVRREVGWPSVRRFEYGIIGNACFRVDDSVGFSSFRALGYEDLKTLLHSRIEIYNQKIWLSPAYMGPWAPSG